MLSELFLQFGSSKYVSAFANRSTKAIIDMDFSELKELRNSLGKHDVSARLEFTAQKGLHTV